VKGDWGNSVRLPVVGLIENAVIRLFALAVPARGMNFVVAGILFLLLVLRFEGGDDIM
jgi:hypothetical protein